MQAIVDAFVELYASKFCEESIRTHTGPRYDHMAPHIWQLHQYNCKLLSPLVSLLNLGIGIFAASVNFFPHKPRSEILIWV